MTWLDLLALVAAGAAAGLINTVVGSGTLITFPTLLALGVPPVTANISNTVGLAPGSLSGAWATRDGLSGQRRRVLWLGAASLLGGIAGALLLLWLPSAAFDAIVPVLIGIGCLLVILQPFISSQTCHPTHAAGRGCGVCAWADLVVAGHRAGRRLRRILRSSSRRVVDRDLGHRTIGVSA